MEAEFPIETPERGDFTVQNGKVISVTPFGSVAVKRSVTAADATASLFHVEVLADCDGTVTLCFQSSCASVNYLYCLSTLTFKGQ